MVRLVVFLAVLAFGLPAASPAQAARLGAMSVLSERGQPFRAEVELEEAADVVSVEPTIVSAETYRDLGLTLPASLRGARVTMARRDSDGRPVVRIEGTVPTESPELIVVLSLGTSAGRHLRSYRLDLGAPLTGGASRAASPPPSDPPVLPGRELTGAVSMPAVTVNPNPNPTRMEPPRDVPRVEALPPPAAVALPPPSPMPVAAALRFAEPAAPSPEPTRIEAARAQPGTITLGQGDTAASIANRIRPADVTEAQALMALHRNNPSAFVGSVYRPRVGAMLRLPDADQMRALPSEIAEQALRAQVQAPAAGSPPVVTTARGGSARGGDRLSLVVGGTGRGKQPDARGGDVNRDIAFDAAMSEASVRIQQLESIVQGLNRLIEERDKQIAAISGQLTVVGVAVEPAPGGSMPVPPAKAPSPVASAAASSGATPPLGAAAATMLPAPTQRVVPPLEPEPWYTDPMVLGAVGVAVLLLGFLVLVMRRRSTGTGLRPAKTGRFANAR